MPAVWNRVLVIAVLAATAGPAVADPPPPPGSLAAVPLPLTLFDVLDLARQGATDDAILAQLRATKSTFTLKPNDVSMLKLFGVSDRVVAAMTAAKPAEIFQLTLTGAPHFETPHLIRSPAPAAAAVCAPPPVPLPPSPPADPARSVGSWVREAGPLSVRVTFTGDRMTGEARFASEDGEGTITFDADYTVNREGLLYGVLTGVDADDAELAADAQAFAGHTFSARVRCDGGVLSVREVKFAGSGLASETDDVTRTAVLAGGRYRKDDGKPLSPPKPKKVAKQQPAEVLPAPLVRDVVVGPDGQPVERLGVDFNAPLVLPAGGVLPPVGAGPAKGPTGTWVREQNGVRVVLKLGNGRLRADVTVGYPDGFRDALRGTWHFDADCAAGPDGMLLCVLTGVELTPPAGLPREKQQGASEVMLEATKLVGEMFRFRTRPDDSELSVRELRVSASGGPDDGAAVALTAVFCGRYQPTEDKPSPPVKVGMTPPVETSPPAECGGMTLPSGQYLKHSPQYFPPDPPHALRQELDAMQSPAEVAPVPRPAFDADPVVRADRLINESEDYRQLGEFWRGFWFPGGSVERAPMPRPFDRR